MILPTLKCYLLQHGRRILCRILLDTAATLALVRTARAQQFRLQGSKCSMTLFVTGGERLQTKERDGKIQLQSLDGKYTTPPFTVVTKGTVTVPLPPIQLDHQKHAYVNAFDFSEDLYSPLPREVDILLSSNMYYEIDAKEVPVGPRTNHHRIRVVTSKLGCAIAGERLKRPGDHRAAEAHATLADSQGVELTQLDIVSMKRFLYLDAIGVEEETPHDAEQDRLAEEIMKRVTYYDEENKRYFTDFLWKPGGKEKVEVCETRALKLATKTYNKHLRDGVQDQVDAAYREMIDHGYAQRVPENELRPTSHPYTYIHTFCVYRPEKETTKVRPVFHSAMPMPGSGLSLNQLLYPGKNLLPELPKILFHFRCNKVAAVADVQKMFWGSKLVWPASDLIRFFYRFKGEEKFHAYRCTGVTFGIASSPYQAIDITQTNAEKFKALYELAYYIVKNYMYVDDAVPAAEKEETVAKMLRQLLDLFGKASMKLMKIACSHHAVLDAAKVPEEQRSQRQVNSIMGVPWDLKSDSIICQIRPTVEQHDADLMAANGSTQETKETLSSLLGKNWDPLGMLTGATLVLKLLLREAWKQKCDWKTPLPEDLQRQLREWKDSALKMEDIYIPRYIPIKSNPFDLIVMGDASSTAMSTAIYLRVEEETGVTVRLLFSKSRVSPLKEADDTDYPITVARLELLAAALSTRWAQYVLEQLLPDKPRKIYYFTDSTITYHRLNGSADIHQQWVANRLRYIHSHTSKSQWRHIAGTQNCSDLATRPVKPHLLAKESLWWEGPMFLRLTEDQWPREPKALTKKEAKLQDEVIRQGLKKTAVISFIAKECANKLPLEALFDRFEHWSKVVRAIVYLMRFLLRHFPSLARRSSIFRLFAAHRKEKGFPSVQERQAATLAILRREQQRAFASEFRCDEDGNYELKEKSSLVKFDPFIDEDNLVRAQTRLQFSVDLTYNSRNPIILPKSRVSEKFVIFVHTELGHIPKASTYYHLLSDFVFVGGRAVVYQYVNRCMRRGCQKPVRMFEGLGQLPFQRTEVDAIFKSVSLDLFGPYYTRMQCTHGPSCVVCYGTNVVKNGKRKQSKATFKRWGFIAVDYTSRAIHVEMLEDCSTECFLNAFVRFTARKGVPTLVYSDNAKTFKRADRELKEIYKAIDWDVVQRRAAQRNITWKYSPSNNPAANGHTERLIKELKPALKLALKNTNMTDRELETAMISCEQLVNDRPISMPAEDDWAPISPSMIVNGRMLRSLPFDVRKLMDTDPKDISLVKLHKRRREIICKFWNKWSKLYLQSHSLNYRHRDRGNVSLKPGDPVLLKDTDIGKGTWRLGRITKLDPATDGKTRSVWLRTVDHVTEIQRPISKLSYLEGQDPRDAEQ